VSEQILNGTSPEIGYTVPFTSIYTAKYGQKTNQKDITKTKQNPKKTNNTKHSKTKLLWFSRLLRHLVTKQDGLILQCSRAHIGEAKGKELI